MGTSACSLYPGLCWLRTKFISFQIFSHWNHINEDLEDFILRCTVPIQVILNWIETCIFVLELLFFSFTIVALP